MTGPREELGRRKHCCLLEAEDVDDEDAGAVVASAVVQAVVLLLSVAFDVFAVVVVVVGRCVVDVASVGVLQLAGLAGVVFLLAVAVSDAVALRLAVASYTAEDALRWLLPRNRSAER